MRMDAKVTRGGVGGERSQYIRGVCEAARRGKRGGGAARCDRIGEAGGSFFAIAHVTRDTASGERGGGLTSRTPASEIPLDSVELSAWPLVGLWLSITLSSSRWREPALGKVALLNSTVFILWMKLRGGGGGEDLLRNTSSSWRRFLGDGGVAGTLVASAAIVHLRPQRGDADASWPVGGRGGRAA
ncbi:hypothetical protein EYF80_029179 [Liparis tanakae]|uniref:Uncharacterized protein n=1 Tax=Liparis tanakae TaxID=230148 RepID=A0A4Z2H401_9TELE|nr:hypothetical protein EYF80_029179 [Liparis tanakae]